jgi:DNA polymerase
MPVEGKAGTKKIAHFVPGHKWESSSIGGTNSAEDSEVMVIGKMPGRLESQSSRNLSGPSGELLREVLDEVHIQGYEDWYVTNLVKFQPPDTTLRAAWIKDCMPLLAQELRLVRPKYILCLGTDASKAILGKRYNVSYMEGRVVEHTFPVHFDGDDEKEHTCLVMTVVHPAQVLRSPETRKILELGLSRWGLLTRGVRFDKEEENLDHRVISTYYDLSQLLKEVHAEMQQRPVSQRVVAVDAEWHGEHPINSGSYMRTVQISWAPKKAACVTLREVGGKEAAIRDIHGRPAIKRAAKLLTKFFKGKRVVGHFFNSDLEWLIAEGIDLREQFQAPMFDCEVSDTSAWERTRWEGGADTGLMAHAIEETASYKLESLAVRYTTAPRYDVALHDWREDYCRDNGLKSGDLEGYGDCPDDVLIPYSIYDADVTLRLFHEFDALLDRDHEGNCCREAYWESMIAAPAVLEIHRTGITVDRERIEILTDVFLSARETQEDKIKEWSQWPDFNIRSVQHVREFLFGEELNGKVSPDGEVVRLRPPEGRCLSLKPLVTTDKPPKPWAEVSRRGVEREHSPSTGKQILSILAQDNEQWTEQINLIRDYRFLDQVLKSILRPPIADEQGERLVDEDGELQYVGGLPACICDDGRVRTHVYQTKETGRWSSARPPLQNISKQRDADYSRLLGDGYTYTLRSILKAAPGHVLIESDYVGAELFGMAVMASDTAMIEHAQRNQLPEDDEDYYDIHSNVACLAFGLKCPPTKTGLKQIGLSHLRIVAKSVVFGIAYGRGPRAISFAAKEQGIDISVSDAARVKQTIFDMYPNLPDFFDQCAARVETGWLCHGFGRFRRFPPTKDEKTLSEFQRQAMNFPIQGLIASAVSRAIAQFSSYRDDTDDPDMFRIILQIHDAILLEVPCEKVEFVVNHVIPYCMRDQVPIHPSDLSGAPLGTGPYYLGMDTDVFEHWGEHISKARCSELGISEKFGK